MVAVNRAQVLVLGVPGRLQECLRSLLKAVPELEILGADKGDWPLADMNGQKPDLVVLDFGSQTDEMARDLAWINAHWPGASCLVVAETARQLQAARAAGASGVLLRGFAADEFFGVLRDLLQGQFGLGREAAEPGNETRASASECDPSLGEDRALLASPVVI